MPENAVNVVVQNKLKQLVVIGVMGGDGVSVETLRLGPGESTDPLPLAHVSSYTHHLAHRGHITIRAV